jgi:serine/threonine protein kinase
MAAAVTEHPSLPQLAQFNEGRLPSSEASTIEAHLVDCLTCCDTLARLSTDPDAFVARLRSIYSDQKPDSLCSDTKTGPSAHDLPGQPPIADPYGTVVDAPATPATDPASLVHTVRSNAETGHVFGDYDQLEVIAYGGMGVVYKARQRSLDRVVALKMIRGDIMGAKISVQRFYQEARAAAALDHPNIVPIYEVGEHDGHHYFTMAFIPGERLSDKVRQGQPLGARAAVEMMLPIIDAVGFAHAHGIIHRDLKPDNVMIDAQGRPRVADFGLAKQLATDGNLTEPGAILGTPSYMAPEQARGKLADIKPATDIYALGGILYFLLTGRSPCGGGSMAEVLARVLTEAPAPVQQLNPQVPEALSVLCARCLDKDPTQRFPTAESLKEALVEFLRTAPEDATAAGKPRPRRRTRVAALVLVASLGLALGIGGWLWYHREPPTAARPQMTAFEWPALRPKQFDLAVNIIGSRPGADGMVELQEGTEVAFEIKPGRDAFIRILTMDAQGEVTRLFPNEYEPDQPFKADQLQVVPDAKKMKDYSFVVTPSEGTEYVRVIATTKPLVLPQGRKSGPYQVFNDEQTRGALIAGLRKIEFSPRTASTHTEDAVAETEIRFRVVPRKSR